MLLLCASVLSSEAATYVHDYSLLFGVSKEEEGAFGVWASYLLTAGHESAPEQHVCSPRRLRPRGSVGNV